MPWHVVLLRSRLIWLRTPKSCWLGLNKPVRQLSSLGAASHANTQTGSPWLLIYDNAEDSRLLNSYWPKNKAGSIIVTSRDYAFASSTVAGAGQKLKPLEMETAIRMVLSQIPSHLCSGQQEEREEVAKIVDRVGRLPLGIQASIGLFNESDCTLHAFNEYYQSPKAILEEVSVQHIYRHWAPYETALAEVWLDIIRHLEDRHTESLLNVLSLLDPDNIQEDIFINSATRRGQGAHGFSPKLKNHLTTLLKKGLVEKTDVERSDDLRVFNIHRLLRDCLRMKMTPTSRQNAFEAVISLLCASITPSYAPDFIWPKIRSQYKDYFPHVQTLHDFYLENTVGGENSLRVPVNFIELIRKTAW